MPSSISSSPKLLKGALVKLGDGFLETTPLVIGFQYNPEKLSRKLSSSAASKDKAAVDTVTTDEPFDPSESFSITLELDAADDLEHPDQHPTTALTGIADRIAAFEMLLYPLENNDGAATAAAGSSTECVPKKKVPVLLLVWGAGRILPVRITGFSIDEQAFSPLLFPIQATVTLELTVLKPESFSSDNPTISEKLATFAYQYTKGLKEGLAVSYFAINTGQSILSMLPF
jgi:hypothetical protein